MGALRARGGGPRRFAAAWHNGNVTLDSFLAHFRRSEGGGPGDTAPVARLERFIEDADFLTAIDLRAGERA
jgi:hypothetical protein